MSAHEEPLELLLAREDAPRREQAERVASFLRLLSADAAGAPAASVAVDLEAARLELEQDVAESLARALEDLLAHHVRAHLGGESFAWCPAPELGLQEAWSVLAELRDERVHLPSVPAPGEGALAVAARLWRALVRTGVRAERVGLWRARLEHAGAGPRAGEAAFRRELERDDASRDARAAALAGVVECLLDRGAVREAGALLGEHLELARGDRRLRRLFVWTRLLEGDLERAEAALRGSPPWSDVLPRSLELLREEWPRALPCLAGRAPAAAQAPWPPESAGLGRARRDLGAAVLALFRFSGGVARPLLVDVAPALRAGLDEWLADREGAAALPSAPEHRLVLDARPQRAHRTEAAALAGALGSERSRSLALAPLLDAHGEVAGWLHVECEHHLLPTPRRLERLAAAAAPRLAPGAGSGSGSPLVSDGPRAVVRERPAPPRPLVAQVFRGLVDALAMKTGRRRWWGFELCDGEPRLAAEGGDGLQGAACAAHGGRALRRSLATGGALAYDGEDARLPLCAGAASGLVLPLLLRGQVVGLLCVESARRRDLRPEDARRLATLAAPFALALHLARLRTWHELEHGCDLYLDAALDGFPAFAAAVLAAGRSRQPAVVSGPPGAGRTVLARWLHFEGGAGRLVVHGCAARAPGRARLAPLLERAQGGGLLLEELDQAEPELQAELAAHLEAAARGGAGAARLLATASRPLRAAAEDGTLRRDLAARLERLEVFLPPLCDRREELPGLVPFLARRFAREEGVGAPRLTDEALALLWRQPWEGELRALEALVYKLVLLHAEEEVGPDALRELGRRFQVRLERKLPSRHPRRVDLVAALRSTRKAVGTINKRRAALFLGWDTDTLAARLREAGLDDATLAAEPRPWEAARR